MATPATTGHDAADRPAAFPWPPVLLVLCVVASVLMQRAVPLDWPGLNDLPARVVGLGLGVAGAALMGWSILTLHRHRTTVLPHKGADALVTDGPFRWRRNPIYIADVLLLLAAAELTKNVWFVVLAVVFAGLVTWLAIIPEERHLAARFGDAYRSYCERTRRWL